MRLLGRRLLLGICLLVAVALAIAGLWHARPSAPESDGPGRDAPPAPRSTLLTAPLPAPSGTLSIRGRVLGPDGPVAQASVVATGAGGEELSRLPNPCLKSFTLLESVTRLSHLCPKAAQQLARLAERHQGEAPAVARTVSGPDGTFELTGLAGGAFTLWAEGAGSGIALARNIAAGAEGVELRLAPGVVLSGKVIGDRAEPLPGASVTAVSGEHRRYFDGESGADGRFLIGPVPTGEYVLVATYEGRLPAAAHANALKSPTLQVLTPLRISGRVVREGHPVPDATVELERRDDKTTTDAQGRFELGSLAPGRYRVTATSGREAGFNKVTLLPGAPVRDVEVRLETLSELFGAVLDDRDAPVADAEVSVRGGENDATVRTDENGHYQASVYAPGPYVVRATASGYRNAVQRSIALAPGGRRELNLHLRQGALLQGVVLDPEGHPVEGAQVKAGGAQAVTTGADGAFRLDGLEPGNQDVFVLHARFASLHQRLQAPEPSARLKLARGGSIEGEVVDDAGAPVAGASVNPFGPVSPMLGPRDEVEQLRTTTTDAAGHFLIEGLPAKRYELAGYARDGTPAYGVTDVEVRDNSRSRARLQLHTALHVRGRFVDPTGKPVADVGVSASAEQSDSPESERLDRFTMRVDGPETGSGVDGTFSIPKPRPGRYELFIEGPEWTLDGPPPEVEAGGEPVTVVLHKRPTVHLRVRHEDGSPFTAFTLDGSQVSTPDGDYAFPAPQWSAMHTIAAHGFASERVELGPRSTDAPVDVVLHSGRRLLGRVVDARTGQPVPYADMALEGAIEDSAIDPRTDASGEFTAEHVGDGAVISAYRRGYAEANHTLARGEERVTLPLKPLAALYGTISNAGSIPFETMQLAVQGPRNQNLSVSADGTYELSDLKPGEYTLVLWAGDPSLAEQWILPTLATAHVTLPEATRLRVDLALRQEGARVRIRVVPPPGADFEAPLLVRGQLAFPEPPAQLGDMLNARLQDVLGPSAAERGVYTFERVPPGHHTLVVPWEPGPYYLQGLDIQSGGEQSFEAHLSAGPPG